MCVIQAPKREPRIMRYELSDIADNLPLRRLQEKVIDILGSVTRVSVETKRIVDAIACAESAA